MVLNDVRKAILFKQKQILNESSVQQTYELMNQLINYPTDSEDIFRLYPSDKKCFWYADHKSVIVYQIHGKYAFTIGDVIGPSRLRLKTVQAFSDYCIQRSFIPVHVLLGEKSTQTYLELGYTLQKLGEEAILDIEIYLSDQATRKNREYLKRRFLRIGYGIEFLRPPHNTKLLQEVQIVSNEWLKKPGRIERGFAMGCFDKKLLNQCEIVVVRNEYAEVVSFASLVPTFGQHTEAKYDLFRTSYKATHSTSDFLIHSLIEHVSVGKYQYLNMGLCPLAGLPEDKNSSLLVGGTLKTLYKTNQLYPFRGSYQFKKKFKPGWRKKYVAYRGGFKDFIRGARDLDRLMKIQAKQ